jgi:sulfite reductase alpha subunit-like flavoprotein
MVEYLEILQTIISDSFLDDWEYDYREIEAQAPRQVFDPAATAALTAISESEESQEHAEEHQEDPSYTYDRPVADLIQNFDRTNLDTLSQTQAPAQAHQYSVSYSQGVRRNTFNTGICSY